jgi:acetyltransferase-like isoleucine patch superfamily enzyme
MGTTETAITAGERVWIGANVTVMSGVDIGARAIISAGAILMPAVSPNCAVAGSPGRVVRKNVRDWVSPSIDELRDDPAPQPRLSNIAQS